MLRCSIWIFHRNEPRFFVDFLILSRIVADRIIFISHSLNRTRAGCICSCHENRDFETLISFTDSSKCDGCLRWTVWRVWEEHQIIPWMRLDNSSDSHRYLANLIDTCRYKIPFIWSISNSYREECFSFLNFPQHVWITNRVQATNLQTIFDKRAFLCSFFVFLLLWHALLIS